MPAGLYSLQKCRGPMLTNDAPGFKAILHNAFHNTLKFLKKHLKRFETHVTSKCLRVSLTALALSKGLKEWLLREVCEAGVASTSPATRSATSPSSCPLLPDSKHLPRYGKTVRFYMVLHWTWFYSTKGACLQHLKTSVSWGDQRTIRTEICTTSKHPKAKAARKSSSLVPKKTTLKLYRHSRPQRDHKCNQTRLWRKKDWIVWAQADRSPARAPTMRKRSKSKFHCQHNSNPQGVLCTSNKNSKCSISMCRI